MGALKESTSVNKSKKLLNNIANLNSVISDLKKNYGLNSETIEKLSKLKFDKKYNQMEKLMTNQERIKNCDNWDKRADIDIMLLEDRIEYCQMIWPDFERKFVEELVKGGIVKAKDFKFAPTKLFERSKQKLLQYFKKLKTKSEIETALYELKDLLRGSVTTDS